MRFIIAFLLFSSTLYGQIDQSPAMLVSSLSVISSSAPNYTVQGSFSSQFGYTRDSIQEGVDVMWLNYTISNPDRPIRALIDSFTVISGNTLRFYVELLDGETVLAFPTGTASIYRPTTNYGFALTEPNESNTTKEQKFNANMMAIDAAIAAAGGTVDSTIYATVYRVDTAAQALRGEIDTLSQNLNDSLQVVMDSIAALRADIGSGGADTLYLADGTMLVNGDTLPAFGSTVNLDTIKRLQNYKLRQVSINNLADNEVPVFILGGQSNAQGGGLDSDATAGELDSNPNVKILCNGNPTGFVDLNIGANNTGGQFSNRHGPELELQNIRDTFFPTKTLYIIKEAIGGTTISPHHLPGGTAYDSLWTHYVQLGINSIIDAGYIPVVSFFYMQGETDAALDTSRADYEIAMRKLVARWQANISPDMPMIFGDVSHGTTWDSTVAIVAAQKAVAADFDLVTTVPTVSFPKFDASHFTYAGQKMLARAFYDALVDSFGIPGVRISKRLNLNGAYSSGSFAGTVILTAEANEDLSINSPTTTALLKVDVDTDETQFAANKAAVSSLGRLRYNNATSTFDLTRAFRDNRGGTSFNNTGGISYGDYLEVRQLGTSITYGQYIDLRKTGGASGNLLGSTVQLGGSLASTHAASYGYRVSTPLFSGGATTTDGYAFFSEGMTATGVTNGWGFYSAGASDKNYFSGNTGFGTTTISEKVMVSGNIAVSGVIKNANGSASAPAYSYTADLGSGMWRPGTNELAWSTGGTERMKLSSGILNVTTGHRINNLAPSGQFIRGDGTNGVFSAIQIGDLPAGSAESTTGGNGTTLNGSAIDLGGTQTAAITILGAGYDFTHTGIKYYNSEMDSFMWKINGNKFFHMGSISGGGYSYDDLVIGYRAGELLPNYATRANTLVGSYSGQNLNGTLANGGANSFFGYNVGNTITKGSFNCGFGAATLSLADTLASANVAIGHHAMISGGGSYNIALGSNSLEDVRGNYNVGFGYNVLANLVNGSYNFSAISGGAALTTGSENITIGLQALNSNTTGLGNIAVGTGAASAYTATSQPIVAIGYQAMTSSTSGIANTGVGVRAGGRITGANHCSFLGYEAGYYNTGTQNTFLGGQAGTGVSGTSTGANNVGIGYHALFANTTGGDNVIIGSAAGEDNTTGVSNNFIGRRTGENNTTGSYNIFSGALTGTINTTGSYNILIGNDVEAPLDTSSNKMNIGNAVFGSNINKTSNLNAKIGINTGTTNADAPLEIQANGSANNAITELHRITNTTSGATSAGFGISEKIYLDNASSAEIEAHRIETTLTTTTAGAEVVSVTQKIMSAGTVTNYDVATPTYRQLGNYRLNTDATPSTGNIMYWDGTEWSPGNTSTGLDANYLKINGNTNAAAFDFGTNDAFSSSWEYNNTKGLTLGATGRLFSGTLTDADIAVSDTARFMSTGAGKLTILGNAASNTFLNALNGSILFQGTSSHSAGGTSNFTSVGRMTFQTGNASMMFNANSTYYGQLDSLGHWRFGPATITGTAAWHTFSSSSSTNGIKINGSTNAYLLLSDSQSESSWDGGLHWDGSDLKLFSVSAPAIINVSGLDRYTVTSSAHNMELIDNQAGALLVAESTTEYLRINTLTGSEQVAIGSTGGTVDVNVYPLDATIQGNNSTSDLIVDQFETVSITANDEITTVVGNNGSVVGVANYSILADTVELENTVGAGLAEPILAFHEDPDNAGDNRINIKAPASIAANYTQTLTDATGFLPVVLKGSATLDFASTAAGTVTDLTITVTGAADGDPVVLGTPNASVTAAGIFTAWVSATDTVTVRFANNALVTAQDPASGTFKVQVFIK